MIKSLLLFILLHNNMYSQESTTIITDVSKSKIITNSVTDSIKIQIYELTNYSYILKNLISELEFYHNV